MKRQATKPQCRAAPSSVRGRELRGPVSTETDLVLSSANDNQSERDERSVTVTCAAERMGCDHTTVRALLRAGELAGIRVGKTEQPRGIRVKLWSIQEYELRNAIGTHAQEQGPLPKSLKPARAQRCPAHEQALAR